MFLGLGNNWSALLCYSFTTNWASCHIWVIQLAHNTVITLWTSAAENTAPLPSVGSSSRQWYWCNIHKSYD